MQAGLINVYPDFSNFGGAQNISISLHKGLNIGGKKYIMSLTRYNQYNEKFPTIEAKEFLLFSIKNVIEHKDFIFISHHRKTTTYLCLLDKLLFLNLKVIHVAHNEFSNLRLTSLYPKYIVSVSRKVKENLKSYFKIDPTRIQVIYNGIEDTSAIHKVKRFNREKIRILYPARINAVKQQVKIVNVLEKSLSQNITIDFAGNGPDSDVLEQLCENTTQFNHLGFVELDSILSNYDFVMLFSTNEGLPLVLIESCMHQTPLLTNGVGGNFEICRSGYNGFRLNSFNSLSEDLNNLQNLTQSQYSELSLNARNTYLEKFSKKEMLDKYANLVQNVR